VVKVFKPYLYSNDVRCIFQINVGLLSTADNSVTSISCGWEMVPRWIETVAGRVDPLPKALLKWRYCVLHNARNTLRLGGCCLTHVVISCSAFVCSL